jgi:MerR family transcriptional regulator, light-induced transcriptional regulator
MNAETGAKVGFRSGMISIGALSRACGIPAETLRTWERRYSFPAPVRKPSGHRLYQVSGIPRLRRIAQAVAQGHRAGDVIHANDRELEAILESPPLPSRSTPRGSEYETLSPEVELRDCVHAVESFDTPTLTHRLLLGWARLGPILFLERLIGPLLRSVGDAWQEGRLDVRHEHFLSERVGDLLRSLRLPFEACAHGPIMVLATPPGEAHNLGLEMAALVLAQAGVRVLYLGTEVPLAEIAAVAGDRRAAASRPPTTLSTRWVPRDHSRRKIVAARTPSARPRKKPASVGSSTWADWDDRKPVCPSTCGAGRRLVRSCVTQVCL